MNYEDRVVIQNREREAGRRQQPMRSIEEINREREQSGWNPYQGEEETQERTTDRRADRSGSRNDWMPDRSGSGEYDNIPNYTQELEEQRRTEQDLRRLQSMYPQAAKQLLSHIEETCDQMEYNGSMMFDERPDMERLRRLCEQIYEDVKEEYPPMPERERDEMLSMQYQGHRGEQPGQNWLMDLIRVMLLQEMHQRRCRYRRCRL